MSTHLGKISFLDTPDVNGANVLTSTSFADPTFSGTGGMILPAGTTAQRRSPTSTADFRFNTTTGQLEVYNGSVWNTAGRVLQIVSGGIAATSGTANKTNTTIPLITEGIAVWSQTVTPQVAGSTIKIEFNLTLSHATANRAFFTAIFAGSTCIGMTTAYMTAAGSMVPNATLLTYTTPSTAPITFSARSGTLSGTGALFVNQSSGGATYGGALASDFVITEII